MVQYVCVKKAILLIKMAFIKHVQVTYSVVYTLPAPMNSRYFDFLYKSFSAISSDVRRKWDVKTKPTHRKDRAGRKYSHYMPNSANDLRMR
jgi:hypothetical protein